MERILSAKAEEQYSRRSHSELLGVPALLDSMIQLDQKRLMSTEAAAGARRAVDVACMQPRAGFHRPAIFNEELLAMPLQTGRRCEHGACSGACSRVFRRGFASADECGMLCRALTLLMPSIASSSPRNDDITLLDTAKAVTLRSPGSFSAHLHLIRLVERMRREIAKEYGVSARPQFAFANRIFGNGQPLNSNVGQAHCDECSDARYHYSGIVYLNAPAAHERSISGVRRPPDVQTLRSNVEARHGHRTQTSTDEPPPAYIGGDLCFVDSGSRSQQRRLLRPEAGLAAIFSSGWENLHAVTPVSQGTRFAVPMFFTTQEEPLEKEPLLSFGSDRKARDRAMCQLGLMPSSKEEFELFFNHWPRFFD